MRYNLEEHTFVVCAYKENEYLEECIISLKKQTVQSKIIMSTSTPNNYIEVLAKKYNIPLNVNYGKGTMVDNWNFGYSKCNTELITIVHQDDYYDKNYLKEMLKAINKAKHPLIFFTNYSEVRNNSIIKSNLLLNIKRIMLMPLRIKLFHRIKFIRRLILSLGCPICCPSVTFVKSNLPKVIFEYEYRSNVDWQAWESLSRLNGEFIYNSNSLTYHRVHEESATTAIIQENVRSNEDFEMFCRFWPKSIAKIIAKIYSNSEKSNKI